MGAIWIALSVLLGMQFTFMAMIYGAVVSGAVALYSKGYGIRFQAIATLATLLGILIANTIVIRIHWHLLVPNWGAAPLPPFWRMVEYQALYDPASCLFMLIGVMTGFIIWREPDAD